MRQVWPIFLGILIVIVIGMIFKERKHFSFTKALLLFVMLLLFSTINFLIMFGIIFLFMSTDHALKLGNIFLLIGIMVVISGIVLYWDLKLFRKFFPLSNTVLTIIEYYIQWTLIYITIYQVIFDNIRKIPNISTYIKIGNILDPNLFVVTILPSFISVWIAVVLFKKRIEAF
ncbi:hypothetical protein [uncultured Lactobacillus sp.]|uniref:SA1002 family membrane protein n=1 Tax=uncultured Lactobacillus sp. TaxID=153152 RepID=UPI0028044241|nr:hypothetical protein [uncultured Lactobacillus sp.]